MIERQELHGRAALVQYLTEDLRPAGKDDAELIRVLFEDDGETIYLVPQEEYDTAEDEDAGRADKAGWTEGDHPREGAGSEKGGQFTAGVGTGAGGSSSESGVSSLKKTALRAFTGKQVSLKTHLTKQESGRIGEAIVIQYLKQVAGMRDAHPLNSRLTNFPVDLIGDHNLIEVKTGLVSNGPSAQKWRATIGQPGKAETEASARMSPEEKAEWNAAKMQAIMDRKMAVLAEYRKKLGKDVKAKTMTVIMNPDTRTADVFSYAGFHHHIRWNNDEAKKAYVGSFNY